MPTPIRFASTITLETFSQDASHFLAPTLYEKLSPTLNQIKVPVMWVGMNRFRAHIQITPEHMPPGRESTLAIRTVRVLADGEFLITLANKQTPVRVNDEGILHTY